MNPKHYGTVKNGKVKLDNREFMQWEIEALEGCNISLEIKEVKSKRSNNLNNYYWGVVIPSARRAFNQEQTFNRNLSANEVHDIFRLKFLGTKKLVMPDGEMVEVLNSTTDTNNQEHINYWENIIVWCAEFLGIKIPYPNEKELV